MSFSPSFQAVLYPTKKLAWAGTFWSPLATGMAKNIQILWPLTQERHRTKLGLRSMKEEESR